MKKLLIGLLTLTSLTAIAQERSKGLFDGIGHASGEAVAVVTIEELVNLTDVDKGIEICEQKFTETLKNIKEINGVVTNTDPCEVEQQTIGRSQKLVRGRVKFMH